MCTKFTLKIGAILVHWRLRQAVIPDCNLKSLSSFCALTLRSINSFFHNNSILHNKLTTRYLFLVSSGINYN